MGAHLALALALVAAAVVSAGGTAVLVGVLTRRGVLDVPTDRSSHRVPVPRGGGAALAAGSLAGAALLHGRLEAGPAGALVVAGVGAGVLGLADDLAGGIPVGVRLAGQLALSAVAAGLVAGSAPWSPAADALFGAVALVWMAGFTNATNFMDGIDGIAAGQAVVGGVALGLVGVHVHDGTLEAGGLVLAAAAVGFAPFNWPRARIFLGDVGSYFAGGWLAALAALAVAARVPPEAAVAPLAVFGADAGVTLVRRAARGEAVHLPHRQHAYQRLVDGGWSQPAATAAATTASAACAALGWAALTGPGGARVAADAGIVAVVAAYLALPALAHRRRGAALAGPARSEGA